MEADRRWVVVPRAQGTQRLGQAQGDQGTGTGPTPGAHGAFGPKDLDSTGPAQQLTVCNGVPEKTGK